MLLRAALAVVVTSTAAGAAPVNPDPPHTGAAGIGDPYYPLDGNGGYDVQHYGLDLRYTPATDVLAGVHPGQAARGRPAPRRVGAAGSPVHGTG